MLRAIDVESPTKVEEYLKRWRGVFTRTAALMLSERGYGNDVMDWSELEQTALEILHSSKYVDELARTVGPFHFLGGPKGSLLYKGNMLMFLVDRLLYDESRGR
jgi:hypothetical protein